MSPSPFRPEDADEFLADFGEALVVTGVPSVTTGLLDDALFERDIAGQTVQSQQTVLKVKRGAFAGVATVKGLTVTVTSTNKSYTIDQPLPRPSSLFDWYALQPKR